MPCSGRRGPKRDLAADQVTSTSIRGHMSRQTRKTGASKDDAAETQSSTKEAADESSEAIAPNPPRTTLFGWFTAPKFGSAGGGGAELDPGPERD